MSRSATQAARYLYYHGRILAVQLDYTAARDTLQQAARKVPAAAGACCCAMLLTASLRLSSQDHAALRAEFLDVDKLAPPAARCLPT